MTPRTDDRSLPDPNREPTITVPRAGRILGMSRNAAAAFASASALATLARTAGWAASSWRKQLAKAAFRNQGW